MNNDTKELEQEFLELQELYPNIAEDIIYKYFDKMPMQARATLDEYRAEQQHCHHFTNHRTYEMHASKLPEGPNWTVEDIEKAAGISFARKKYTKYDFAFVVNYLHCLFKHFITEPKYYIKMATAILENHMIENADDAAYYLSGAITHT